MKVTRGWLTWVRWLLFAATLFVAGLTPGMAADWSSFTCQRVHCESAGSVRWIRAMPGSWAVQDGAAGTTPASGQAYAALGAQVAVVGAGLTVTGYQASTGQRLWTTVLAGFPAGSQITAVRVWPGVVTVGVMSPVVPVASAPGPGTTPAAGATPAAGTTPGPQATPGPGTTPGPGGTPSPGGTPGPGATPAPGSGTVPNGGPPRREVLLRAATGHQVRAFPAAQFGGAVAATQASTVIVGPHAVTSYANRTGAVRWSRSTGPVPPAWQVDGTDLYLAVAAGGYLGSAPVTALRRINLATGAQRLVRPGGKSFDGALSLAYHGVVVFASDRWARAYSGSTGRQLWRYPGALPDMIDTVAGRLYLSSGNTLIGVNPRTGQTLVRVTAASSGLYGIREGAVLGIDHGALGKAWAYDIAAQQVLWTSRPLPWPHYFVDLSGIGGSTSPGQDAVLLAICGQVGPQPAGATAPRCGRPELALLNR